MTNSKLRLLDTQKLILISIILACFTPRFIRFMKLNVGFFNMSFYSIAVLLSFFISQSFKKIRIKATINTLFLPLLLLVIIIDVARTDDLAGWTQYFFYALICNLLLILLNRFSDKNLYLQIVKILSLAVFIHIMIGFFEITTHQYIFGVGHFSQRLWGNVAVSIFYNPNDYSMFISTMCPFVFYMCIKSKGLIKKLFYGFTVAGSFILMILTSSRAAIISIFMCGFLLGLILFKNNKYKIFMVLLVFAGVFIYLTNPSVQASVNLLFSEISIDTSSQSDSQRINLIRNGFYFLNKTHWLGVGAGNLKEWLQNRSIYYIGRLLYIHNWYMEVLVTFGVIVFLLYAWFHINIFRWLYKGIKTRDNDFGLTLSFFMSFVVFSITSISSSSNIYSEWFWMYIAIVSSYITYLQFHKKMSEV